MAESRVVNRDPWVNSLRIPERNLTQPIDLKGKRWCTQGHKGPVGLAKCPAGKPTTNGLGDYIASMGNPRITRVSFLF
jgi:hypothetical protein